jgi:hypothetical protein
MFVAASTQFTVSSTTTAAQSMSMADGLGAGSPGSEHRHIISRADLQEITFEIVLWSSDLWHCIVWYPEGGGSMFCRNPGDHEAEYTEL